MAVMLPAKVLLPSPGPPRRTALKGVEVIEGRFHTNHGLDQTL